MFNENLCLIKDYVKSLAQKERVKSFYPHTISRKLNIPLELVVLELPKLIEEGCIELKYEIRCTNDLTTRNTVDNYKELLNTTVFCDHCGEDIELSYNNVYPIYFITDEYKEYVKKKL